MWVMKNTLYTFNFWTCIHCSSFVCVCEPNY
ncbi:hypothetical protein APK26_gp06 [Acinetobacter phage vB_AbaP_APK26]|uniref:Uncharacterized protein n=1 Tax=Acinetobacter phage vB_AbaP_APK26 TaxID=2797420 RepID=A0A7T8J1W1_9CAUD|nr:hypothetical protein APK26_gp06 [Acinetobacter phage vB_AbaP_APK26]